MNKWRPEGWKNPHQGLPTDEIEGKAMKFWEVDLILTDRLIAMAEEWHSTQFPKCRGSIAINKQCNHFKWFFAGCRCVGLIASENEAKFMLHLGKFESV
jgi:hypothetical protein